MLIDNSFASKCPNMLVKSPLILTNGLEKTTINTKGPCVTLSVSRTGARPGAPEAGPRRFGGRGRSGLTIDLGMPRGRAPKVLRRTGRGGLGCEQAYWIP